MKVTISNLVWIKKSDLTLVKLQAIKAALTIRPRKIGNFPGPPPSLIMLYRETPTEIGVAREFFLERKHDGHELVDERSTGGDSAWDTHPIKFSATLREAQQHALDALISAFDTDVTGGMLRAPCGSGKTVLGCAFMASVKLPTLVVVHKEFLMNQWRERIEQFLPGSKIGLCQGPVLDYKNKHVVLAMVHSLSQKEYPDEFKNWPGVVITDECHRISASSWAPVSFMFPAKFKLGLSATIRRKDGTENVFYYSIGKILHDIKEQRMHPKIRRVYSDFHIIASEKFNPSLISKPLLLRFMCANKKRNELIVEQVCLAASAGRKVLILSERLEHLSNLMDMVTASWSNFSKAPLPTMGKYVGGMEEEDQEDSKECQLIFGTTQLISEGFDEPSIDTLVMATPISDAEQAVGRCLRPHDGKKEPIVVDIRDDRVAKCVRASEAREELYKKLCAPQTPKQLNITEKK